MRDERAHAREVNAKLAKPLASPHELLNRRARRIKRRKLCRYFNARRARRSETNLNSRCVLDLVSVRLTASRPRSSERAETRPVAVPASLSGARSASARSRKNRCTENSCSRDIAARCSTHSRKGDMPSSSEKRFGTLGTLGTVAGKPAWLLQGAQGTHSIRRRSASSM